MCILPDGTAMPHRRVAGAIATRAASSLILRWSALGRDLPIGYVCPLDGLYPQLLTLLTAGSLGVERISHDGVQFPLNTTENQSETG